MSKTIKIGGRIESAERGGVVTGANAIFDDTQGKKQDVINSETDAELERLDGAKQNVLTFDNQPTENSNNPVTSGGVYAADVVLQQAIEAILQLIPSAATALNQLADKAFVNSTVATDTATFRGTYNVVTDLSLHYNSTHQEIATALLSVAQTADNNDYCFVQIPVSDSSGDIRVTERYKFNGTAWSYEYDLNNSGFTADQWAAINSTITLALVQKLGALPTAAELAQQLATKQNTLTFDAAPVADSDNPVKSGGLYNVIAAINATIPSGASVDNKLVAESRLTQYVAAIVNALDATFNVTSTDGHVNVRLTQVDGVITSVEVITNDIASASALSTLAGRVTTNEGNISLLQAAYNALQQSAPVIVEPTDTWPVANPSATVIYRVVDRVNTPPQYYSDYMWNGTSFVLMATYNNAIDDVPTAGSNNLVKSGGVYNSTKFLEENKISISSSNNIIPIKGLQVNFVCTAAQFFQQYNRAGLQAIVIVFTINGSDVSLRYDNDEAEPFTNIHRLRLSSIYYPQYEAYITYDFSSDELGQIEEMLLIDTINFVKEFEVLPVSGSTNLITSGAVADSITNLENVMLNAGVLTIKNTETTGWQPVLDFKAKAGDTITIKSLDNYGIYYIDFRTVGGVVVKVFSDTAIAAGQSVSFVAEQDIEIVRVYFSQPYQLATCAVVSLNDTIFENNVTKDLKAFSKIAIFGNPSTGGHKLLEYSKFRVTNIIFNTAEWWLYFTLQGFVNGQWEPVDSISIEQADAPTDTNQIKILVSKYGTKNKDGFMLWFNPSLINSNFSSTSIDLKIKNSSISYIGVYLQEQINEMITIRNEYEDYAIQDHISHTITVDANGNGDFTTISDAVASIINSSYNNQYGIFVKKGTYNENNIIIPPFTHIYGESRDECIVTSQGFDSTYPVFDQIHSSKLSNLTVISYTGYCVHFDQSSLPGCVAVNTNCVFRKEYGQDVRNLGWVALGGNVIYGTATHIIGTRFINKNCVFENGIIAMHSIGNPAVTEQANQLNTYEDCVLMNAYFEVITLNESQGYNLTGINTLEIKGLITNFGFPSITMFNREGNCVWHVIGGNNKNLSIEFVDSGDLWDKINTNEKGYIQLNVGVSATEGKLIDIFGDICNSSTPINNILGFCLNSVSNGAIAPVWVGNAYPYSANDGEYGIDDTGSLDANANIKIGFVKNNIFYRY